MKLLNMRIARIAGIPMLMLVLLTAILPAAAPLSGPGAIRVQAAGEVNWVLQDKETRAPIPTFQKDASQPDGSLVKYTVTASETDISYHVQTTKAGKVTFDVTYSWTFERPPSELIPGQIVELDIQGKGIGQVNPMPARYYYHADYVENFQDKSADQLVTLRLNATSPELSDVLRFTVPPIPPVGRGGQITLIAEIAAIQTAVGTSGQVVWIYRAPEEEPPATVPSPAVSDPLFNADGSLNRAYFDQVWKKYSDLDDSIPVNERSYEAKQPGASWITRPGYSFFSAIWRWTGLPAWSCWNTGKLW
ncbi:MAG TPA: hypothetical protein VJK47_03430 [Dehalococcoidales bacterium]|nr:hypothetical protein [Dehalococcoidales bacterium]